MPLKVIASIRCKEDQSLIFGETFQTLLRQENVRLYNDVIQGLFHDCKTRAITFLVNSSDPTYGEETYSSMILQPVRGHITQQVVWREDFNALL